MENRLKKAGVAIIILLSFFLFQENVIQWYNQKIVENIFSKIPSNSPKVYIITFIFIEITIFYFFIWLISNRKIKNEIFLICLFAFGLYIYYRFFTNYYDFYSLKPASKIKYSDSFLLFFSCFIIAKIFEYLPSKQTQTQISSNSFLVDSPWKIGEDDLFNRLKFADELAKKIQAKPIKEDSGALAIGIDAPWGSGKTSFINQLSSKINSNNSIIIHFNPWRSSSPNKIIEDFFELLIDELAFYVPQIKSTLLTYAKTLTTIDENIVSKIGDKIIELVESKSNKNKQYNEINSCISELDKRIIIFIDDIDRLDKKEIIEVLKIVRNTANFNNLIYIVAYDKGYVLEAIKDINKHNYLSYIEKIFQFEFSLPKYNPDILRNELKKGLQNNLKQRDYDLVCNAIDELSERDELITSYFIKTQRDVIRLLNAFLFEYEFVKENIQIMDFYFLQLLKLKYPIIYRSLYERKLKFFLNDNGLLKLRLFDQKKLNPTTFAFQKQFEDRKFAIASANNEDSKILFEEHLKETGEYDQNQIDEILNLVEQLLKQKQSDKNSSDVFTTSFVFDKNFDKYFHFSLLNSDIPHNEFEKYRRGDFELYKKQVFIWLNDGKINELSFLLENIKEFNDFIEWENHYKILLVVLKFKNYPNDRYDSFYMLIIDTLKYPKTRARIQLFDNESEYLAHIKKFFSNAPSPYVFESNILYYYLVTKKYDFILTIPDIEKQLLEYLRLYCKNHSEITADFRSLHSNCVRQKEYTSDFEILPDATNIFREYFQEYLKDNELGSFIMQTNPGSSFFNLHNEWLNEVFESKVNFEEFLKKFETQKTIFSNEFIHFYNKYNDNDKQPIEYEFKHLKPIVWQ